jgi:hypothetical protein
MWRTESKLALVAIALIVLGGIYGMSNKSNNRKADAIAVLMENGEVDSYNNVLFYTANDEQMDQRTLSALSYLSRGYDMVQVYKRCLTTMTKSYGLLISQVGIQYTKHLRRSISVCL